MQTSTIQPNETNYLNAPAIPNLAAIKSKQKATWEAGDFGQIARSIENFAEDFMRRQPLARGGRVLDLGEKSWAAGRSMRRNC